MNLKIGKNGTFSYVNVFHFPQIKAFSAAVDQILPYCF